jgi:hypothetical protein
MSTKSKMFRVATSGNTVDGRELSVQQIKDLAASYDTKKYGARVWCEHLRGLLPDSVFKAFGDVRAVEAREVEGGKWGLFAEIDPTPELVTINRARQKVYSSIEIIKDPDTGGPYLGGLSVTDSPASTGTDMLMFSRQQRPESMFTDYIEGPPLEFIDTEEQEGLFSRVKALLGSSSKKSDDKFSAAMRDVHSAVETIAQSVVALEERFAALPEVDGTELKKVREDLDALTQKLSQTPQSQRPAHSGGDGTELTDC